MYFIIFTCNICQLRLKVDDGDHLRLSNRLICAQ